jgi:hypothetical protein
MKMLYREIFGSSYEGLTEHTNAVCEKNVLLFNVKLAFKYSNH